MYHLNRIFRKLSIEFNADKNYFTVLYLRGSYLVYARTNQNNYYMVGEFCGGMNLKVLIKDLQNGYYSKVNYNKR